MGRRTPPRSDAGATSADEVELGYVSGVFGVRGEVRLHLHNPGSDLLRAPRAVVLVGPDATRRSVELSARPGAGRRILGRIAGVEDRDAAEALIGWRVRIPKDALPAAAPGEYYVWQLEGAAVLVGEERRGTVARIHRAGPVDVLEVATGGEPAFVPMIAANVAGIDVEARVIRLVAGALDEPEP